MTKMRLMVMVRMVMLRKYTDKPESTEPDSHPDYAASTRGSTPTCSHLQSTQEADKGISLSHSSQMSVHHLSRQPPSSKRSWIKNLKMINIDYHCHTAVSAAREVLRIYIFFCNSVFHCWRSETPWVGLRPPWLGKRNNNLANMKYSIGCWIMCLHVNTLQLTPIADF